MTKRLRFTYLLSRDHDFQLLHQRQHARLAELLKKRPARSMLYLTGMILMKSMDLNQLTALASRPEAKIDKDRNKDIAFKGVASFVTPEVAMVKSIDTQITLEKRFVSQSIRTLIHLAVIAIEQASDSDITEAHDTARALIASLSHHDYVLEKDIAV